MSRHAPLLLLETMMSTMRRFATCSAALFAVLVIVAVALAGDYEHPKDKKAYRSMKDKLETGVVFTDLARSGRNELLTPETAPSRFRLIWSWPL